MADTAAAIALTNLVRRYGRTDAVNGLSLTVPRGGCYGFFGRNGAGKTTTIKCLLNLLRPTSGGVRVLGLDPQRDEVAVKSRIAYVPDQVAFYPWMSVADVLEYAASFRRHWNFDAQVALLGRFNLGDAQRANQLSKGQKTQLALIAAICAEPELLVLDEPTSGLDPIVRREFIETVIGAYQDSAPGERTVFVSTHLISEFEGLIDEFTIIDAGRAVLTMDADAARRQYHRVFAQAPADVDVPAADGVRNVRRQGRDLELTIDGDLDAAIAKLQARSIETVRAEALSLEEIFVATLTPHGGAA
jgi:ABC-2 type transport system ATP-binding protein